MGSTVTELSSTGRSVRGNTNTGLKPMFERLFMHWYRRQIACWRLLERVRAGRCTASQ